MENIKKLSLKETVDSISAAAKVGAVSIGGLCLISYSHEIGQFPEGISFGDGVVLFFVCFGFFVVYALYVSVITASGSLLMAGPAVLHQKWLRRRSVSSSKPDENIYVDYSSMWDFPVVGLGLLGFAVLTLYAFFNFGNAIAFLLVMLMQGFLISLLLTTRKRSRIFETGIFTGGDEKKISDKNRKTNFFKQILLVVLVVCPFWAAPTSEFIVDGAFSFAQLRKNNATIHVKKPWSVKVSTSVEKSHPSFLGEEYLSFEKINVLLRSVGTKVVIELPNHGSNRTIKMSIPSDAIYVE